MDVLHIVLIILVLAGIWAVVELALTFKRARTELQHISHTADETAKQIQPMLTKVDTMLGDAQPSVQQIDPLLNNSIETINLINNNLDHLDHILGNVSEVSNVASNASLAAGNVVSHVAQSATKLMDKVKGKQADTSDSDVAARLESPTNTMSEMAQTMVLTSPEKTDDAACDQTEHVSNDDNYVTYTDSMNSENN